jgi:VWFA-related protein
LSALLLAFALAAPQAGPQAPRFGVSVESVYVDVFVTDGGAPVLGLTAADFELKDDGVRQDVELAGFEEIPLTTVLVLDTSGSVAGEKLARLRDGVRAVLRARSPADLVGLVTFDQEVRVRVPPGPDTAPVERELGAAMPAGATALYDALYTGAILASDRGRSLLVVFTDGEDNLSWLDVEKVARVLQVSNVLVQVVGVGAPGRGPDGDVVTAASLRGVTRTPGPEPPHVALLRRLAESTGGRFWSADDPGGIAAAFEAMVAAMKTRYVLRFDPGHATRAGRHAIEVKLRGGRRGKVHCRKAYFAALSAPSATPGRRTP